MFIKELNKQIRNKIYLWLVIPLIIGITIAYFFDFHLQSTSILSIFLIVFILYFLVKDYFNKVNNNYTNGLFIFVLIFLLGIHQTENIEQSYSTIPVQAEIIVDITEMPLKKDKIINVIVDIIAIKENNKWKKLNGKMLAIFDKDSKSNTLQMGDRLVISSVFNKIENPGNPYEFNFKQYLNNKGIFYQTYLLSNNYDIIGNDYGNIIYLYSEKLRQHLLGIYKRYGIKGDEFSIAAGLTLGYRADIRSEINKMYSASGAMHILSVSGLHVGIIFAIFNFLLLPMDKFRRGTLIKSIIIIVLIWFYAILTGLSPSVMRSATMFSFILVAGLIGRRTNTYNSVFGSMFILLFFNPFYLFNVGFQLSYLAVIGIIYIYSKINNLINFDRFTASNWLLSVVKWVYKAVWALISVSISAQIATIPLGFYYFHQFPNYFILTNIAAIPISFIIMMLAIVLFCTSSIPIFANLIAQIFNFFLFLLNKIIFIIANLPYSTSKNIYINELQVFLIFTLFIFIIFFLFPKKRAMFFKISLSLMILVFLINVFQNISSLNQKTIIIYNIKNKTAINLIDGKSNILVASSNLSDQDIDFLIKNNWIANKIANNYKIYNINSQNIKLINYHKNFIQFYSKKILIVNKNSFKNAYSNKKLELDYIILSKGAGDNIENLKQLFKFKMLIIDSSIPFYQSNKIIKKCKKLKINYFDINEKGAFAINL